MKKKVESFLEELRRSRAREIKKFDHSQGKEAVEANARSDVLFFVIKRLESIIESEQ
ncbi:MAG: hypothetical protein WC119_00575 [Synergistaceae bacterium]